MEAVRRLYDDTLADLSTAHSWVSRAVQERKLPEVDDAHARALLTTLACIVVGNVAVAALSARGRRLVLDTLETVLAVILIILLLAFVLGLPLGIVFLALKALAFLLQLALGLPLVGSALQWARELLLGGV